MVRLTATLAASLALLVPAASGAASPVRFVQAPARALAGSSPTVTVAAPSGLCTLTVKYSDGKTQPTMASTVTGGKATWKYKIPETAQAGAASFIARCGSATATKAFLVVGGLIPAKISVVKSGFSIRPKNTGGTDVSYGVLLKNQSPNADATNVSVLVNFVMADNRLIGSAATNVATIAAGSVYALGAKLSFPAAAPVVRLEVVIQVGAQTKAQHAAAAAEDVGVESSSFDQGFVGAVSGELINASPTQTLIGAQISAVVLDANGVVLGGGSGSTYVPLPPGTRQVFKLSQGFDCIPIDKAATVVISIISRWRASGT